MLTQPVLTCAPATTASPSSPSKHWQVLVDAFKTLQGTLRRSHVPPTLGRALFRRLFSFSDEQLFNQMVTRRECCSYPCGDHLRAGLCLLSYWAGKSGLPYLDSARTRCAAPARCCPAALRPPWADHAAASSSSAWCSCLSVAGGRWHCVIASSWNMVAARSACSH
jgi:hypothetical protein